ncbi:hypothetical protein HY988_04530 [Candidatus Micrarchaeota archaeon]|nr:hypothetical protein [Candidatus Micrarchaeota archaeon]
MTNLVHEVWKIIEKEPSIQLDLQRNLINVRALARFVGKKLTEQGMETTEDAIISAIRRYPQDNQFKNKFEHARKIVAQSTISIRSHIANIAVVKGKEAQDALERIFSIINFERGETLRVVQGEESIKILIDEKNVDKVLKIIPKDTVIKVQKNLAEINLHLHPEAVNTPGIVFAITTDLLLNNVVMYEIMSCVPEMLIFVEEKDLLKAHQVLFELCHSKKGTNKS